MKRVLTILLLVILTSCTTKNDIDITDYSIVTTVAQLSDYYILNVDTLGTYETTNITTYFDGSEELEYTYELLESEVFDPLYYSITIEKERTLKDAKEVYLIGLGAVELVGNTFGQGMEEIESIDIPGDDSYYALRTLDGEPNGMYFSVRKGTVIFTMMVSGLYTSDNSLVTDLIIPKLTNLENFKIIEN